MDKMNKSFKFNDCNILIKFVEADKYGVDRHLIIVSKPMYQNIKEYTFLKNENEIIEFSKKLVF